MHEQGGLRCVFYKLSTFCVSASDAYTTLTQRVGEEMDDVR